MCAEVDETGATSYPNETDEQKADRERREAVGQGQPAEATDEQRKAERQAEKDRKTAERKSGGAE